MVINKESKRYKWIKNHAVELVAYGGLAFCLIMFTILTPMFGVSIWSPKKLATLMSDVIVLALASVGAVFPYALGAKDISIGKQIGLYATLFIVLGNLTDSLWPGIIVSLAIAMFIAVVNGAAGDILHIVSIIPSVVFMMILSGISTIIYVKMNTRNIALRTIDFRIFKSPWFMLAVLVAETIIVYYLFNYTKLGKNVKAIGANQQAAKLSGVNIIKYKILAYVVMGVCVVIAALFQMGYTGSASDSTGTGFEMNVMVALILGGMPLSGGMRSKVSCALVGSFTYSLLDVGLPMIGVSAYQVFLFKAILFLIIVCITCRSPKGPLPR